MKVSDISAAQPGVTLKDDKVPGLQLRAFEGSKAFYLYYRAPDGRQRKPKLGEYPTMTLPYARRVASDMLAQVMAGKDPSRERQDARKAPTMDDMLDRYVTEHGQFKKSSKGDERLIRLHIKPKLGNHRVAELDYEDVRKFHDGMKSKVQANRALALLSTALNMAEKWDMRPIGSNPCKHIKRNPERGRRRYMTGDEAKRISAALAAHEKDRPQAVAFIRLLIYTGARKGEIAAAKWGHLDGDTIRLPDSKSGEPRTIYLPPAAMDVISALPRTKRGNICGIQNPHKTWVSVRKMAKCDGLRIHDLRHSFASAGLAAGLTLDQIGELLGHNSVQTTKGYAHLMDDIARASAATTADIISGRMRQENTARSEQDGRTQG